MNDLMIKRSFEIFYDLNREMRVRSAKTLFQDKIYPAVFAEKIIAEFTYQEVKKASREGWIEKQQIVVDGRTRNVFLWKCEELSQVDPKKKLIKRIKDKFNEFCAMLKG